MTRWGFLLWFAFFGAPALPSLGALSDMDQPPEKSAYFAYVDRDYIFTVEAVRPGIPLLNFVSMIDQDSRLIAKNTWLAVENRKIACKLFSVETSQFQESMKVASMLMHPRSSFGIRLEGDFGGIQEFLGVTIRIGSEDFRLTPLSKFDFETLALKVNHLNLGSPDFSEDFQILNLRKIGNRSPVRK